VDHPFWVMGLLAIAFEELALEKYNQDLS